MTPTVEVVLCTCNGERFVAAQLASIAAQSRLPERVAIHDDASTDNTLGVLRDTIAGFPAAVRTRFAVHRHPRNLGFVGNFAQAIRAAQGDVLLLCDQDDVWERHKVATLAAALMADGPDLVFSDGALIDGGGRVHAGTSVFARYGLGRRAAARFRERAFACLLRRNYVNGAAMAIRRDAAQAALPIPRDVPHDYWLALWCALHRGVVALPAPLYRYRLHGGNAIGIGGANPLHAWLGMWRHPDRPRQLERARWEAMAPRLFVVAGAAERRAIEAKLAWLRRVLGRADGRRARFAHVVGAALRGDYRTYGPPGALSRDLVSTLRQPPARGAS